MDDLPQDIGAEVPKPAPLRSGKRERKPALVINVYSWATPLVGLAMLLLGLLGGYYGRQLFQLRGTVSTPTPSTASAGQDQGASLQVLMGELVGSTRHYRGSANAPVTIIEFSDFQ